jgi:hypothetical protein
MCFSQFLIYDLILCSLDTDSIIKYQINILICDCYKFQFCKAM